MFSPSLWLVFSFSWYSFTEQNFLASNEVQLINSFMDCAFVVEFKSLPHLRSSRYFPMSSSRSFSFMFYIYVYDTFWVNFCEECKVHSSRLFLDCFACRCPGVPVPFVESIIFALMSKIGWLHMGLFLGSLLCSIDQFILSPTPHCLDCCSFTLSLKEQYY